MQLRLMDATRHCVARRGICCDRFVSRHARTHRTTHDRTALAALLTLLALAASGNASAGPVWEEPPVSDAGWQPVAAQITRGDSALYRIIGQLCDGGRGSPRGCADQQDMFLIFISDPENFLASTSPKHGGSADFDSALWLFRADGCGLLAHRHLDPDDRGATLTPVASDSSGAALIEPGYYFLAISANGSFPIADDEQFGPQALFDFSSDAELSGPDGPGGGTPICGWVDQDEPGSYSIALEGADYAAPPCRGDLNYNGSIDSDDVALLVAALGCNGDCNGDLNRDGMVNVNDLALILQSFGSQCGPTGACCLPDDSCEELTVYQCIAAGGVFHLDEQPCASSQACE
jgi:hypothetical protein